MRPGAPVAGDICTRGLGWVAAHVKPGLVWDRQDAFQEAAVSALSGSPTLRRIRRDTVDQRRKFTHERQHALVDRVHLVDVASPSPRPDEQLALADEAFQVRAAVAALPPRLRHLIEAHYFAGCPFGDLATELSVSAPRVSQPHSRALRMLRESMVSSSTGGFDVDRAG